MYESVVIYRTCLVNVLIIFNNLSYVLILLLLFFSLINKKLPQLKAGPHGRAPTPLQARSRAASPPAEVEEQLSVRKVESLRHCRAVSCCFFPSLLQHASPPADMGFIRELSAGSAAAPVRVLVSFSRGNPPARV